MMTHCALVSVVCRSLSMLGMATLSGEVVGDHEHAERHGHEGEHGAPVDLPVVPVMYGSALGSANPDRGAGD